jgi:hypothetical protein
MNKKRNCRVIWRIIIIGFMILLVHVLLTFKKGEIFNCDYLNQGLNMNKNNVTNTPLDNDKYCKLPKVKGYCYMNALVGYFNIYDNLNNCTLNTNYKLEKINIINDLKNKYKNDKISENTKIFGYPLTNSKEFYFNEIEKNNINENIIKQLKEKCNNISKENKNLKILLTDFQNKYRILQDIHLELKQKLNEKKCSEFKILKNENINIIKKYNNDDNNISELIKGKNKENKLKSINNLIEEKNNMENKKTDKNEEDNKNLKAKELFSGFYKKFTNDKLKENKLKMIIGIYLQKQKNDFNKFIKEYKNKNKKLLKSVRKLNDQIVEYKLNKINNNNIDNSNSENA